MNANLEAVSRGLRSLCKAIARRYSETAAKAPELSVCKCGATTNGYHHHVNLLGTSTSPSTSI